MSAPTLSSPSLRNSSRMRSRIGSPSPRKYFATRSVATGVVGSRKGAEPARVLIAALVSEVVDATPGGVRSGRQRRGGTMRRTAVALAFVFSVAAIAVGSAGSATSKSAFLVFVEPTLTAASNGLTLETELEGTFNVADK